MLLDRKDVSALLRCKHGDGDSDSVDFEINPLKPNSRSVQRTPEHSHSALVFNQCSKGMASQDWSLPMVQRRAYGGVMKTIKWLVSPSDRVTRENVALILARLFNEHEKPRVLIIGGGTIGQGMTPFYEDQNIELVSFDIYASKHVQFIADAHSVPLEDNCFDAVIVQAVLEHVLDPKGVVDEVHRLLKPDGLVYAETPFLQHVHEGAYDFTRFTESGHRLLFKQFSLVRSGVSSGAGTQLLWAFEGFFRGLFRSRLVGKVVKLCLCWLMLLDRLIPESYNIDAANGVFFLGSKANVTVGDEEIITHYKGAQKYAKF